MAFSAVQLSFDPQENINTLASAMAEKSLPKHITFSSSKVKNSDSYSVSDSLLPHGLQPSRLLCLWNSPGKTTGVGSCSLLQEIFSTQGLNPGLSHCRLILYHRSHKGSPWQFSSVQSLSRVRLFATPWTAACQASLSITNFQSLLKLMSIESVMPSSDLIL